MIKLWMLWVSLSLAAWPDSYPQRVAMMEAFRLQFATPEYPVETTEIAQKYARACELGFSLACKADKWGPETPDPIGQAAQVFGPQCRSSQSPLACVLLAFELGTVNGSFTQNAQNPTKARSLLNHACTDKLYAPACSYLGHMENLGLGGALDSHSAQAHFEEGCKARDAWGCYQLGLQLDSHGLDKSEQLLQQACQAGIRPSCIAFANSRSRHASSDEEWAQIEPYLSQSCALQNHAHCAVLGTMKMNGLGVPRQPAIANALFESACQSNEVSGCIGSAQYYQHTQNLKLSAARFKSACELGHAASCAAYGTQLLLGAEGDSGVDEGAVFLRTSCSEGALDGCLGLANAYRNGIGIQSNLEQGIEYARRACRGGLGAGCTLEAEIQEKLSLWGQGDASSLYEQGCSLGDGRACGALALKRLKTEGFTTQNSNALTKGCDQGDMQSCRVLGEEALKNNLPSALPMLKEACLGGDNEACLIGAEGLSKRQNVDGMARLLEEACHRGFPSACDRLRPIAFAADFSNQSKSAFLSSLCQVWSVDKSNPEENHLLAEVSGAQFYIYIGNHRNQDVLADHDRDEITTQGNMNIGQSYWRVSGQNLQTKTDQSWGELTEAPSSSDVPSDLIWGETEATNELWQQGADWSSSLVYEVRWPTTQSGSFRQDTNGTSTISGADGRVQYSRNEETLQVDSGCGFVVPRAVLFTEHCSEVQALMAGYLLLDCPSRR